MGLAGDYGSGIDELNQRQVAEVNRDYILGRVDHIAPFFYHDRVYGIAFELPLLLAEEAPGLAARGYAIIRPMLPPLRHIVPPWAGGGRAALNFLADRCGLMVCILFLLAGLALAGDYGGGIDELQQRNIALANLDYIRGQGNAFAALPDPHALYGAAFELPLLLTEQALGLEDYYYAHRLRLTLTHLFFIIGAFFCWRLAYRLTGSRGIALIALLLFLLHPRIYVNSYLNSKDLPLLSMLMIALYLLERAFRKDTVAAFILLGIAAGLLTNLRIMGIMLFPAVIALRGLDWFYAGAGPQRKRILLTAGLFLLAGGLTVYALAPYAWANPVDYIATSLNLTVNHPTVWPQLFQGELIPSDELPPHYNAVWFGITTPPPILLLGFIGVAAVAVGICRRPGAAFRNTNLRLQLLLLAAFLLPLLASALLNPNQTIGWRQLYFVYAPFCLLAAAGLHWLTAARGRRRIGMAGVYGLAGLGLGLILLSMAQIHPFQQVYFNFLGDRTTPEYLRTQYFIDSVSVAHREGLEYLAELHPEETLIVRVAQRWQLEVLPPEVRRRLLTAGGGRNADYELIYQLDNSRPDVAFNSAYPRRFYNNTLIALRPLDAARMTPAAQAAYRELYRAALAGEPIIRADYKVYRHGQRLTFVRENCPAAERDMWFGVKVIPRPAESRNLPFRGSRADDLFSNHRVRLGELCLAVIQLPDYVRGDLILSQRNLGNFGPVGMPLWEEIYSLSRPGLGELIADYRRQNPPAGPASFEVFLDRDAAGRPRLLYAKKDCTQGEYATGLTLRLYPERLADLPADYQGIGYESRDFHLSEYGGRPGGECLAIVPLPDYPLAEIHTGQTGMWAVNLYPPADPGILRAAYAALSDRQPAARTVFDLYRQDNRLLYLRETCAAADTAAAFFLHIIPQDIADLPAERQAAGFANRDFAFDHWGGHIDGNCLAAIPLPDYPIKAIRTGQYVPGQGEIWGGGIDSRTVRAGCGSATVIPA